MLHELPDDLNNQSRSVGPPTPYYGLPKPSNCEGSAVLIDIFPFLASVDKSDLDGLKYERNEYASSIPKVVRRYTKVDPLSPFFRSDRAKYGYGGLGDDPLSSMSLNRKLIGLAAGVYGYQKTKNVGKAALMAVCAAVASGLIIQ